VGNKTREEETMPRYRITFRGADTDYQVVEANQMGDSGDSYVFYDARDNLVAQVPKDTVLSVVVEEAIGG